MTQLAKKVLKNSIYNSLSTLIVKVGGLVFTIIVARMLLPELYGIYLLALSIGLLMLTFTDLGINGTMVRYVSYALGKNDETLARSYFRYLSKAKFLLALMPSVLIMLLAKPLAVDVFHKPLLFMPLVAIGFFMFVQSFFDYAGSCFNAFQRFEYISVAHAVTQVSRLILVPLLIFLGFSVFGAVVGLTISVIIALLILIYFLAKNYRFMFKGTNTAINKKKILKFLSYLTIGGVSGVFFAYVDSIMLGIFMPAKYVGFYGAGYNIVFAIAGLISIAGVLFPVFTQLEGMELKNAFQKIFKYSAILAFPSAIGLAFIAKPLIGVVYGADYLLAVAPMYILSFLVIISPFDFISILFNAKEKPQYPAGVVIISSALNVVLNYVLILRFGMIGAAIATVTSRYFNTISLGILAKKVLDIHPSLDSIYKPLFSSLVMLLFLYLIPRPANLLIGITEIFAAAIVYLVILYLIKGIEKHDWDYLRMVIKGS